MALVFYRLSPEIAERKRLQEAISFERGDTFLPDTVTLLPSHQLPPVRIIIEPPASNKNITLLGEMGDLLRTCRTLEEA